MLRSRHSARRCDGSAEGLPPRGSRARSAATAALVLALIGSLVALAAEAPAGAAAQAYLLIETRGLAFAPQAVGTISPDQEVTLRNAGNATLTGLTLASPTSPAFPWSTTCGASLAPGATCTATYAYAPATSGASSATAAVTSSAGSGAIALRGTTTEAPSALQVDATRFDLGIVPIGATSDAQTMTVTNTSDHPVSFARSGGTLAPPFERATETCTGSPKVLAPGASCQISHRFRPIAKGVALGATTYTFAVAGRPAQPVQVNLVANGIDPILVTPTGFDFGEVPVGTASPGQVTTLTNTAAVPVTFTPTIPAPAAPFGRTTTCSSPTTLLPGGTCTISHTMAPTAAMAPMTSTTAVAIAIAGGATIEHDIVLTGSSTNTAPYPIRVTPTAFDFGAVWLGASGAVQSAVATNISAETQTMTFAGGGLGGFSGPGAGTYCGGASKVLAPGESCANGYAFEPAVVGPGNASTGLTITSLARPSRNWPIAATGQGIWPLRVSPTRLDLGPVPYGTTSAVHHVTVTNTGTAPVPAITTGESTSNPFATTSGCTAVLDPGASCQLDITYTPDAVGPASGTVTFTLAPVATASRTFTIDLTGTGVGDGPQLWTTPTAIDFGPLAPGAVAHRTITVTNGGSGSSAPITVTPTSAGSISLGGSCPALAAGAS